MSAWRREALQRLPECRQLIEESDNPMALWINLHGACEDAYGEGNDALIQRFYDYARWCWQSSNKQDVRSAVACAFYEHLPLNPVIKKDLPRRMGRHMFNELRDVFRFHLSPEEATRFEQEFSAAEEKFVREIL